MLLSIFVVVQLGCANRPGGETGDVQGTASTAAAPAAESDETRGGASPSSTTAPMNGVAADVVEVVVSGGPGAYTFAVTLRSPDTGCDQYADWWEVLDADGTLLYRRILGHSHVDEQPFTRTGSPVPVTAQDELWVRAHMHGDAAAPDGYGGQALRGTVDGGFVPTDAEAVAPAHEEAPLPESCAF